MLTIVDEIDDLYSSLYTILITGIFLVLPFIAWAQVQRRRAIDPGDKRRASRQAYAGMAAFAILISVSIVLPGVVTAICQTEVEAQLAHKILEVRVDGRKVPIPDRLIADLRGMDTSLLRYTHSHPTRSYSVDLKLDNGDLRLNIARDSDDIHAYWVL